MKTSILTLLVNLTFVALVFSQTTQNSSTESTKASTTTPTTAKSDSPTTNTPTSGSSSTAQTTTLLPKDECPLYNSSCDACISAASHKCVFCYGDEGNSCFEYPVGDILPNKKCALSKARWGVCWVNFEALIIAMSVIGGLIILTVTICCIRCCCCRGGGDRKYMKDEAKWERQKAERKQRSEDRRADRKERMDEIRRKYGFKEDSLGRLRPRKYRKLHRSAEKTNDQFSSEDTDSSPSANACPLNDYMSGHVNVEQEAGGDAEAEAGGDAEAGDDAEAGGDEPIYKGHWMPASLSVLLISLFAMCHSVSGVMLSDLLVLISLHCLSLPKALQSVYQLRKAFASIQSPLQRYYYCSHCLTSVTNEDVCPNTFCSKPLTSKSFFLVIPIVSQIKALFQTPSFLSAISHRFRRQKKVSENIEDIYDAEIYKKFVVNNGPLSSSHPYNLSFIVNTDGVPLFKSSQMSMWPVYLMINELPFKQRTQKNNMVMYGIWFGATKPCMSTFCQPLHSSLADLEEHGVIVDVEGKQVKCRCFTLGLTTDLPARSAVLNMVQFNGAHSCLFCTQKGKNFRTLNGGNVHVFPYSDDDPCGPVRTSAASVEHATTASDRAPNEGIKGFSFLMTLNSFDYVQSCGIDYMHCVLLGVTKCLLKIWFLPANAAASFSLSPFLYLIDSKLSGIKPPTNISRLPRSIGEHVKFWKASELRAWLLFYSVPVLRGILPFAYFYHYVSFVEAISLLLKDSIGEADIARAQLLLEYFVYMMKHLYGERYLTLNVHMLLHLPSRVRCLGPLWTHSCFPFENLNGNLLSMFHGTQHVDVQILNAVTMMQVMPQMVSSVSPDSPAYDFLRKLCKNSNFVLSSPVEKKFLGKAYDKLLSDIHHTALFLFLGVEPCDIQFYRRLKMKGLTFHSRDYTRSTKRDASSVMYEKDGICKHGIINWFCSLQGLCCSCKVSCDNTCSMFACVSPLVIHHDSLFSVYDETDDLPPLELSHIKHVQLQEDRLGVEIIPVNNLGSLLVSVNTDSGLFICKQPNGVEGNL